MFVRRISSRARSKVKRKKGEEGKNEVALKEQRGGLICQDSIPFIGGYLTVINSICSFFSRFLGWHNY
jgi:hypothetical protein